MMANNPYSILSQKTSKKVKNKYSIMRSSSDDGPMSDEERVQREIQNAKIRLMASGEPVPEQEPGVLVKILENLGRFSHATMGGLHALENDESVGEGIKRGFLLQDRYTGRDVAEDMGISRDPLFRTHIGKINFSPSAAGIVGLGMDLLNPLDPLNWVGFGIGKGVGEAVRGEKLLTQAFGKDVTSNLVEKFGRDWVDKVDTPTVGQLVKHISDKARKMDIQQGVNPETISDYMRQGIEKTGVNANTRIQPMENRAIKLNVRAPFVNKDISSFSLPGSQTLLRGTSRVGDLFQKSPLGQTLGQSFSTSFKPNSVPASVWTRMIRQGVEREKIDHPELVDLIQKIKGGVPETSIPGIVPEKGAHSLGGQLFFGDTAPALNRVNPVEGVPGMFAKPRKGFWTSSSIMDEGGKATSDWEKWINTEGMASKQGKQPYELTPLGDAKILELSSTNDIEKFLKEFDRGIGENHNIDWDAVGKKWDGVHFNKSDDVMGIYSPFYGVDAESTLWLNPEKIIGTSQKQLGKKEISGLTLSQRISTLKDSYPGMFENINEKNADTAWANLVSAEKHLREVIKNFKVADFKDIDPAYLTKEYTEDILKDPIKLRKTVIEDLTHTADELNKRADILATHMDPEIRLKNEVELEAEEGSISYGEIKKNLLNMESKSRIREQSFEGQVAQLFKGTTEQDRKDILQAAIYPEKTVKPEHQHIVDAFKQWRDQTVEDYRALGVTFTPLENYVPFVSTGKSLTKDEAAMLKGLFGHSIKRANSDDFLSMISGADPYLRERTLNAVDPAEINKVLGREWLTEDAAVAMSRRGVKAIRGQEASTFLVGTLEKYGLTVDDLSQLKSLPEGYVMVKPRSESSGRIVLEPVKEGDTKGFALPEEFAKAYKEYTDLMFHPVAQSKLLQFYDQLTRAYKTMAYMWTPGHIPRDWMSNVQNLWLADVRSPKPYIDSFQVMNEAAGHGTSKLYTFPEWEGTGEDLYNMAKELGLTESSSTLGEFQQAGSDWSFFNKGKYTQAMRTATRAVDNHCRIAGMIDRLNKGDTPEQAVGTVKKYLFDYFDLTPTERKVFKRIVPFYTWMRKNIPLQIEALINKPGKYSTMYKLIEDIGNIPNTEQAPGFIADSGGFQLEGKDGGTYVIPNLAYADLGKIPVDVNSWRELSGSISPLIRGPFEMLGNTQLFSGQPIENYAGQREKIPFGPLLEMLGKKAGVDIQSPTIPSRTLGYLLNQIPPLRNVSTITDPTNPRAGARFASILGGPQMYPGDWAQEAATYETRNDLRALLRSLQDRGRPVPTIAELTPKKTEKNKKNRYSIM